MLAAAIFVGPLEIAVSPSSADASRLPEAILGFAGTALWGLIALMAIIVFRHPLAQFLSSVGGRLTKISVAGIELELAESPKAELNENLRSFGSMDPQDLASSSTSQTLVQALSGPLIPDSYAVIDLGIGKSWLISRLFIFAVMLRAVRGVRCFVFVDRSAGVPNEYIGTISTEDLRWRIAENYKWLEQALSKAYKDNLWRQFVSPVLDSGLESNFAAGVVQEYIKLLKKDWNWAAIPGSPYEPAPELNRQDFLAEHANGPWVSIGDKEEYGFWIDREILIREFKGILHFDRLPLSLRSQDKIREIVGCDTRFVAVVRSSGQFVSLVDRARVLADVSKQSAEK